jgi:predicted transcriptional regulator of viral defense system
MNNPAKYQHEYIERIKATELATWLLSRGIPSISTDEIASLLAIPKNQVSQRLAPLKKRGEIVLLANGLWAPVPPEYLTWGAPPAMDIIDVLMCHLSVDYYVGWLSAASLHGSSHHAPQVFQVATSRAIRAKKIGRSNFRFYHRSHIHLSATDKIESRNGLVFASSRETTLLDIANDIGYVGGIDNAANIIIELTETTIPSIDIMCSLSEYYPISAVRRLGFLMERFTDVPALDRLKKISDNREASVSIFDPQSTSNGSINKYWQLKINNEVHPDV